MFALHNLETGELGNWTEEPPDQTPEGFALIAVTPSAESGLTRWRADPDPALCGFFDVPTLDAAGIVALYTPSEKLRIFASNVPEVRTLIGLLQFRRDPILIGGVEHSQGTALIAGLGLLDGPDRAARILAGEPPE